MPKAPTDNPGPCVEASGIGNGNCYFVDSEHSNSWRLLRIINEQENLAYVEYDNTFKFNATSPSGEGLQFYELYDLNTDVYQVVRLCIGKRTRTTTKR